MPAADNPSGLATAAFASHPKGTWRAGIVPSMGSALLQTHDWSAAGGSDWELPQSEAPVENVG